MAEIMCGWCACKYNESTKVSTPGRCTKDHVTLVFADVVDELSEYSEKVADRALEIYDSMDDPDGLGSCVMRCKDYVHCPDELKREETDNV